MAVHLGAIAAGLIAKKGYQALFAAYRISRTIRLEDAAGAGPELKELAAATADLRIALHAQTTHLRHRDKRSAWEDQRQRALRPAIEFVLALRIVELLRTRSPMTDRELAAELGATTGDG